jgi:hypothetical protein
MARMGHSSAKANLAYQHATAERDGAVADYLGRSLPRNPIPSHPWST